MRGNQHHFISAARSCPPVPLSPYLAQALLYPAPATALAWQGRGEEAMVDGRGSRSGAHAHGASRKITPVAQDCLRAFASHLNMLSAFPPSDWRLRAREIRSSGSDNPETLLLAEIEAVWGGEAEALNLEIAHYRRDSASAGKVRSTPGPGRRSCVLDRTLFRRLREGY